MVKWNLCKTSTAAQLEEWEPIILEAFGPSVHDGRKKGYIFAREALRLSLKEMNCDALTRDLAVINFNSLKRWPELTLSLSHTKSAGAALLASGHEFLAVGIDIELSSRAVSPAVKTRVTNPQDLPLEDIELWCLKEATYKCLLNSGKVTGPFAFAGILIEEGRWTHQPSGLKGLWELKTKEQHTIALAMMPA